MPEAIRRAVLAGLDDAPGLLERALHVAPPRRPYHRVEIAVRPGDGTQGEALALGAGAIRLNIGSGASPIDARGIARHEALHLILASALRGKWDDPELAFTEWIVRGIESGLDGPRFHAPLPGIVQHLPKSREEVEQRLQRVDADYFGDALTRALEHEASPQRRLWLVEAALGIHHLEAAARLGPGALRAVIVDDWLLDYEQYARAVGNAPADAGNLWRLSDPGWSRDPLVRLSAAAQALQRDDRAVFAGDRFEDEPSVWKNRGRVRLPLLEGAERPRPPPVYGFRAALGGLDARAIDESSRGEARFFEARALWPRILARLLAAGATPPDTDPEVVPLVQIADGPGADEAFRVWTQASERLRAVAGDYAPWIPLVAPPREIETAASILLVHGAPPSAESILSSRRLAAQRPVRSAVFRDHLGGGNAWERLPDLEQPLDPRYRDEVWSPGPDASSLPDLPALADAATAKGRLTSPLAWILSTIAFGVEECHYRVTGTGRP